MISKERIQKKEENKEWLLNKLLVYLRWLLLTSWWLICGWTILEDMVQVTTDYLRLFLSVIWNFLVNNHPKILFSFSEISTIEETTLKSIKEFSWKISLKFGAKFTNLNNLQTLKLKNSFHFNGSWFLTRISKKKDFMKNVMNLNQNSIKLTTTLFTEKTTREVMFQLTVFLFLLIKLGK